MAIQHLEQKRLVFALKETSKEGRDEKKLGKKERSKNYDSMVKKVPTYILNNGLLYTLAYLNEKDPEVLYDIWNWHCSSEFNERKMMKEVIRNNFLNTLFNKPDSEIRIITLETLALLKCMRRFVKEDEK